MKTKIVSVCVFASLLPAVIAGPAEAASRTATPPPASWTDSPPPASWTDGPQFGW